ncbi:MAG: hypothetical protein R2942_02600 [Ignavibacteria bacterium]
MNIIIFIKKMMFVANEEVVEMYDRKDLTYELAKEFNLLVDIE